MSYTVRSLTQTLNGQLSRSLSVSDTIAVLSTLNIGMSQGSADGTVLSDEPLGTLTQFIVEIIQTDEAAHPVETVRAFVTTQSGPSSDSPEAPTVASVQAQLHSEAAKAGVQEGHNMARTYVQYAASTFQGLVTGTIAPGESHLGAVATQFQTDLSAFRAALETSCTPTLSLLPAKNDPIPSLDLGGAEALLELAHSKSQPQLTAS